MKIRRTAGCVRLSYNSYKMAAKYENIVNVL